MTPETKVDALREPSSRFLQELAHALRKAKHQNVAEHMASGMLWAMYPEWFEKAWVPRHAKYYQTRKK